MPPTIFHESNHSGYRLTFAQSFGFVNQSEDTKFGDLGWQKSEKVVSSERFLVHHHNCRLKIRLKI
jgi:hypothetical protein